MEKCGACSVIHRWSCSYHTHAHTQSVNVALTAVRLTLAMGAPGFMTRAAEPASGLHTEPVRVQYGGDSPMNANGAKQCTSPLK